MSGLKLLVSDHHGVYIPKVFLENFDYEKWNILPEDSLFIENGPEDEGYWTSWDYSLGNASYIDEQGNEWHLFQDGDLWAYCPDLMTDEEYEEFFGEKRETA